MRKNLLKTMLVTVGLVMGVNGAWAEDVTTQKNYNKVLLYDFENAEDYSAPWTISDNITTSQLLIGTNNYIKFEGYKADMNASLDFTDKTTNITDYKFSFDFGYSPVGSSQGTEGVILTVYAGENKLFYFKSNTLGNKNTQGTITVYNSEDTNIGNFKVDKRYSDISVLYTISIAGDNTSGVYLDIKDSKGASVTLNNSQLSSTNLIATKLEATPQAGQTNFISKIAFDNVFFGEAITGDFANAPTFELTKVNGKSRIYTISFKKGETLYCGFSTTSEEPTSYAKAEVTEGATSYEYTANENGTIYAYTQQGAATSDKVTQPVTATEIELNKPTYSITNIANGYNKTFSIACNNDDILLKPTATLTYSFLPANGGTEETGTVSDKTINATQAGTYTITANAEGYTSSSITIDNNTAYTSTKVIDITAITKDELSTNWTLLKENSNLPGNSNQWPNKYPNVIADEYFYNFSSETASSTDIIDGLNIEYTANGKTPMLYTGFGLMYPIYELNTDGATREENKVAINTGKVSVTDATSEQYCIYTYINNYGKNGTKKSVLQGNESYNLYRYSDVLTKIEVYSPATPVSVSSAGLATYAPSVALDFTNAENIAAYKAKIEGDKVILEKVTTVAAGEGVLLSGKEGAETKENIAIAASTTEKNEGNAFIAVTESTVLNETDGEFTNYVLSNEDGVVGFFKANNTNIAAGKAYLKVATAAAAKGLKMVFGDATGISSINTVKADDAYYTLSGVRVANPTKGLYIQNGKKVIVK